MSRHLLERMSSYLRGQNRVHISPICLLGEGLLHERAYTQGRDNDGQNGENTSGLFSTNWSRIWCSWPRLSCLIHTVGRAVKLFHVVLCPLPDSRRNYLWRFDIISVLFSFFFFFKEGRRRGEEGRSYVTGTFFLQRHDDFARMEDLELIYCGKDFYPWQVFSILNVMLIYKSKVVLIL